MEFKIGRRLVGPSQPTYFIADIAANHDGSLDRARMLIRLAREAGADAAKFQNFRAPKIVSDYGFRHMDSQMSHQATWKRPVFEVYERASLSFEWTPALSEECAKQGIDYFTSPYDDEAIEHVAPYVHAFKIGSGEIDWIEALEHMAEKKKPIILATGAADMADVQRAVHAILRLNNELVLMQCNTNYTASPENYDHIHLNVLRTYAVMFPQVVLGLSDHTHGNATVLGAVALGARVIERHFTDDNAREGPDHKFAMNPSDWAHMVEESRQLERALGSADKFIAANEGETSIIQRRCLRAARDIEAGEVLTREAIDVLRPATAGAIRPHELPSVLGTRTVRRMVRGQELRWTDLTL